MVILRDIQLTDYSNEYFNLLSQLTIAPVTTFDKWSEFIKSLNNYHRVIIIVDTSTNKIVGTGTILIEKKLIHSNGLVAHIEDIVTDNNYRGKGLGKQLINYLVQIATDAKCYKIILDCSEENIEFYSKCNFQPKGVQMAKYIS